MTVIACVVSETQAVMACDTQMQTEYQTSRTPTKVWPVGEWLIGAVGGTADRLVLELDTNDPHLMADHLRKRATELAMFATEDSRVVFDSCYILAAPGQIWTIDRYGHATQHNVEYFAFGSGAEAAMGAMWALQKGLAANPDGRLPAPRHLLMLPVVGVEAAMAATPSCGGEVVVSSPGVTSRAGV